ncbi:helix-turn-helix transcriptional regulator [Paenibacillus campi]|uniref:helix-turn-helix domain-containing protein n=1 Tax=Paenibacillus campi TaxID=3106031 RepID=UPI002AFDDE1C|nr:helix-turn-helix transcriptional regulator [Paenibacillus sp. SGZ-1009]
MIPLQKSTFSKLVGKRVRKLREEKRWTREQLAEDSALHVNSIKSIELGEKMPSIYTVYKIAFSLNMKLENLVSEL